MYIDKVYTGIEVTNPPDKIIYTQGDNFDASGMIVSALDSSGAKHLSRIIQLLILILEPEIGRYP